jgi:hypothetical protein
MENCFEKLEAYTYFHKILHWHDLTCCIQAILSFGLGKKTV